MSLISIILVIISIVGFCLNTFSWMQHEDEKGNMVDNPDLAFLEAICISYFTAEYILRWEQVVWYSGENL